MLLPHLEASCIATLMKVRDAEDVESLHEVYSY